jgi:hypothetical protein
MIFNFTTIKSDPLNCIRKIPENGNYFNIWSNTGIGSNRQYCNAYHLHFPAHFYMAKLFAAITPGIYQLHRCNEPLNARKNRLLPIHFCNCLTQLRAAKLVIARPDIVAFKRLDFATTILTEKISNIYAYIRTIRLPIPKPRRHENFFTNLLSMG